MKVFVGRAPELAELEAGLTAAIEGRGRPFVISGEPGIGKTRLADELADRAASRGVRVLWGRCWEGGGAPAYWPWIQVIRTLFGGGGRQRPDAISPEIADLVPELSHPSAPDAGQSQETTDPEQARFRLFDAVARALRQSVRLEPMLVVLEDLHGADQDSLQMLKFAARELKDTPVMVVGTYRDLEVRRSPTRMALIADIAREGRVLALGGLSDREVAQLVEGRTGVAPSSTLVAELHQATAGNPLFVDGVVRLLAAEGRSDAASGAGFTIPDDVREAIRRWLSTLSDSVRTVLTTAALMGNEFELRLLECVSDASPGELLDSLAEACEAGIAIKGGGSRYRFSHGLFRQVLDDGLASATRMQLHQRIGVELEKRCGPDPAAHLAALAHHFGEAAPLGEFAKAIDYSIRAGEAAYAVHAYGEATVHWEVASRLMPEHGDARRPRLLGRLALALAYTRASDAALRLASQAGAMIATSEGQDPAADYMADAAFAMSGSGSVRGSWALAAQGLGYIGDRRDAVWARLAGFDVMREEAEDPDNPGTMLDSPRRRELAGVIEKILAERRPKSPIDLEAFVTPLEVFLGQFRIFPSREDLLGRASNDPVLLLLWAGEFRRALPLLQQHALRAAELGATANAVRAFGQLSRCHTALGDFPAAWASYGEAGRFAARLTGVSAAAGAQIELCLALDEGWARLVRGPDPVAERAPEDKWVMAAVCGARAQIFAPTSTSQQRRSRW